MENEWMPIEEPVPVPVGVPLIVTVYVLEDGSRELRYPVYYMKKRSGNAWCYYDYSANAIVKDAILAWMEMPDIYKGD